MPHNEKNRKRSAVVAFHVTPEESAAISMHARLSGLTKQDYIIQRCLQKDIVVYGNPRVYKALKGQLERVYDELQRLDRTSDVSEVLIDTIQMVAITLNGINT